MLQHKYTTFSFFAIFAFLLSLNILLPSISDDFDAYLAAQNGFESAKWFYLHWNARIGELLHKGLIGSFNPFIFDILNASVGTSFIFTFFMLVFGRIPKYKEDIANIIAMLILILFATAFGSVFLWGSGSLNYLWGISFIVLFLLPYRFYIEKIFNNGGGVDSKLSLFLGYISPFGFIAGMASEQIGVITIISLICISIYLKFFKRVSLPLWYYLGIGFFIAGFLCLYLSPGHHARASTDAFKTSFLSITELIELSFLDKLKRIARTLINFKSTAFLIFNITLITLTALYYRYSNKLISGILYIFALAILLILNNNIAITMYPIAFILLYMLIKKDRFYIVILFIYTIFVLTALCTIQAPFLPSRARFGDSMILIGAILLMLNHTVKDHNKFILISSIIFIIYGGYVTNTYIQFRLNWNAMIHSIEQQKQSGNLDVVVDGSIFRSNYRNFGDWGNIGDNPNVWPNTVYKQIFEVNSIRTK